MPDSILLLCNPALKSLVLLDSLPDDVNVVVTLDPAIALARAEDANILVLNGDEADLIRETFLRAGRLQWIHSLSAGLERKLIPEIRASAVPLTNARGVYAESLGEFVLTGCLYFAKDIRRMLRQQMAHEWAPFDVEEIRGKSMCVVGYGEIGRAAAKRAQAMGMRVTGIRRHPERSQDDPYIERCVAFGERGPVIAESDFVVVAAPNTPETRGLVGPAEIASMKRSAVLVNVGRGPVVDEAALIAALREQRILGAALDVFDTEPLPAGHAFYDLENVLLSPHCADHTPTWLHDSMSFFLENYRRFRAGEPLRNIVDKELGY